MIAEKRKALCLWLNIPDKLHNINHERMAVNFLTRKINVDPQNILNKYDWKVIVYFMNEIAIKNNFKVVTSSEKSGGD